jgi:hypothetical protein
MGATSEQLTADEQRLAELGYKQELKRGWSGFSNFAISFSIISILAGCFTTYGQAWYLGWARNTFKGPVRTIELGAEGSEIKVAPEPTASS